MSILFDNNIGFHFGIIADTRVWPCKKLRIGWAEGDSKDERNRCCNNMPPSETII